MNESGGKKKEIALIFDRVSFSYPDVKILQDASFHIHQGEFIALVGPNGSGKTTVLKLLLGLAMPQSGIIKIAGEPATKASRESLGYVPQQLQTGRAFPVTVHEVVKMGRLKPFSRKFSAEDTAAVDEAMDQAEIADLALRQYSLLSGGQKRRVLVARALASRPTVLVLDEPAANMDQDSETRLYSTLEKIKGKTSILIVTHDRNVVSALTDRVLCMGGTAPDGRAYGIVQHPVEESRVIHGDVIPSDQCGEGQCHV